jgi:hypothetical protein
MLRLGQADGDFNLLVHSAFFYGAGVEMPHQSLGPV